MRFTKILLVCLFCVGMSFGGQAQTLKSFTPDSVTYFEEMTTFFVASDKKRGKEFMEEFELAWYGGKFTDDQRERIYRISNIMLKKRMRPYPQFKSYLFSLMSFLKSSQTDQSFNTWMDVIEKLAEGKKKKDFEEYIKISSDLFADNVLYRSQSVTWQSSNDNYEFVFDSVPKIIFPSLDLKCYTHRDSSVIYNTKGVYYPQRERFVGDGGKLTWERVGLDQNETYAIIGDFNLRVKSARYDVDSVVFYNAFFQKPLIGKVSEKVLAKSGETATYPRFESYDDRLKIPNIVEGVDYEGGFTMHGGKLLGSGTDENPAQLLFYRNEEVFLIASSKNFSIKPKRIRSPVARIVIFLDEDSIVHPGLNLKFLRAERVLTLVRDDDGMSKSPYYNTYHNVDMDFEALYWKIDDPLIEMGALFGSTSLKARFKSVNYYKQGIWELIQGMDAVHPLIRIKELTKSLDSREFHVQELANSMKLTLPQVIPMVMNLSNMGFLAYDPEQRYCVVNDKTYDYVLARAGKTDYDGIEFNSEVRGEKNATLNLLNYELTINGVRSVVLSDSQQTTAIPSNRSVLMTKDRNFSFKGLLVAGRTVYFGKEFSFEYEEFRVNLINVDSMRLKVLALNKNPNGYRPIRQVRTAIEGVKGVINIDNPFNKSGIQDDYHEYPVLRCTKKSYAFYDKKSTQRGAYTRDKFYFQLEPFTMDSLDNFSTEDVGFDGIFVSAGIFPDFEERLTVQKDYSLGFIRTTPKDGFGVYGDKGEFNDTISLSNYGLEGNGTVDFLTSTSVSSRFTFFPDSTTGIARFVNEEKKGESIEFPEVLGEEVRILYLPQREALIAKKLENNLQFFGDQADLDGSLVLRPTGMFGRGVMTFDQAVLKSKRFDYKAKVIDADTAVFELKSLDLGSLAFATNNVKAHVDFDERTGEFTSNGEETFVEFPVNEYICYMDVFKWFMDDNDIELQSSRQAGNAQLLIETGGIDLPGSNFYSVNAKQDSLNFIAPKARYDLDTYIIYCTEVPYIQVADANIQPDSGQVEIHKKAKMETLINAQIVANKVTKYHTVYNSSVNIFSKTSYAGTGDYDYVDENKMRQTIHFNDIAVDTSLQTVATAKVSEDEGFTLSPNFEYKGDVKMFANKKGLQFVGGTRISHNCPGITKNWMNFDAEIDPNDIFIPVSGELKDADGNPIGAGIVLNPDSVSIYSTFLSIKKKKTHTDVITADGFLFFDKKKREYQISNRDKLKENTLPGNFVSLNIESCMLNGDGQMNLGVNTGQVKFVPYGKVAHNMSEGRINIRASIVVDFLFNDDAGKRMAEQINNYPDLEGLNFDKSPFEQTLRELMGLEGADKVISELTLNGKIKRFPDELLHTMFLADVKLEWNQESDSYRSIGEIGIGNIGKQQVFKYVKGHIEMKKKKGGDVMHIYLELDPNNYYHFTYSRGIMQVWSSDSEFNTTVKETKDDKRKSKGEKGDEPYLFSIGSRAKLTKWLSQFD